MPNIKKLQGKRILIVDDQPFISEILTDLLSRYDHPSQANTGRDALEQIKPRFQLFIRYLALLPLAVNLASNRVKFADDELAPTAS
jgi:CheY-like chemotaxis protein